MLTFRAAFDQDDMEVQDYVRAHIDISLSQVLDGLLEEETRGLQTRLGNRMLADLSATLKQTGRVATTFDVEEEMTDKALKLRKQRVARLRQEISFLQIEEPGQEAEPDQPGLNQQIYLFNLAEHRIDRALKQEAGFFKRAKESS
jgi:hypothetical protein